ncbi:MAG: DUF5906 domain-containing protein [Promethearchaeia archaeon]
MDQVQRLLQRVRDTDNQDVPPWEIIKNTHSITELVRFERNRAECYYGNSDSPSLQYYPMQDHAYCHKCDKIYDYIEWYALERGIDRSEAIRQICEKEKIPYGKKDKAYYKKTKTIWEIFERFMEICHERLCATEEYKRLKERRGFSDETVKEFKIGLYDAKVRKRLEHEFNEEALILANIRGVDEKNHSPYWSYKAPGERIVYPYLDINRKPKYFIYRWLGPLKNKQKYRKYQKHRKNKYIKEIPFGLHSLYKPEIQNHIIITEGITDAISVIQAGYPCLSPVTTHIKPEHIKRFIRYCKGFNKTYVIFDNEENQEGLKGAKITLKTLLFHKISAFLGNIPRVEGVRKVDLNDYLKQNSLNVLLIDAKEGFEFLMEEIDALVIEEDKVKEILRLATQWGKGMKNKVKNILVDRLEYFKKRDINRMYKEIEKEKKEGEEDPEYMIIARALLEEFNIVSLKRSRKLMITFNGGYYEHNKSVINHEICKYIEAMKLQSYGHTKNEVKEYLKDLQIIEEGDFYFGTDYIPFKNGYYNVKKEEFIGYSEKPDDLLFFYALPHEFKKEKGYIPKKFEDAVKDWIWKKGGNAHIEMEDIYEIIGYILTSSTSYKTFFSNLGEGNTGKTQFMNILSELIGATNMTSTNLHLLDGRFETNDMQFKILINCADMGGGTLYDTSMIKLLTGGDKDARAEEKGGEKFNFRPSGKFFFNLNKLPKIHNIDDNAFFSRAIIIYFDNKYEGDDIIRDFYKTITDDPDEMRGIIHKALDGLKRLKERGYFRKELTEGTKEMWLCRSDMAYDFVSKKCQTGKKLKIKRKELWDAFVDYGGSAYGKKKFYSRIEQFGHKNIEKTERNPNTGQRRTYHYFTGITLRDKLDNQLDAFGGDRNLKKEEKKEKECEFENKKEEIMYRAREIYEENGEKPLNEKDLREALDVDFAEALIEWCIKRLKKRGGMIVK